MRIEQAVFTSVRGERLEGYQLAAASEGLSEDETRELTAWGPAHESLLGDLPGDASINFHRLESGRVCLSKTTLSGSEYSGRAGGRVYTQMFVLTGEGLLRFGGNPFQLLRSLSAAARVHVCETAPRRLRSLPLLAGAAPTGEALLAQVLEVVDAEMLAELVKAVQSHSLVAVSSPLGCERLFEAVVQLLPVDERLDLSFATGLRFSSRRSFRLSAAPRDASGQRLFARQAGARLFDLTPATV